MTLDTYGHLFPRGDDGKELAEAELRLIGGRNTEANSPMKIIGIRKQ
jgi:hypothetical protein